MKKRNYKEENHYYVQWGIAALILIIYVVATLVSYNNEMKAQAQERVLDRITKQAIEVRGYYGGIISSNANTAAGLGNCVSEMDDIFCDEAVSIINSIAKEEGFDGVYIVKSDGTAIDNDGNTYKVLDNSESYMEVIEGKKSFNANITPSGDTVIVQAAPIQKGNENLGYLIIEYTADKMSRLIDVPVFSYAIVYENGLVLETLGEDQICKVGDNFIETIKQVTFQDGSYTTVSQAVSGGRSTNALITSKGTNYYLVTQPISNADGEVIIIAKENIVKRNTTEENANTKVMVLKLVISLLVFILLIVVIYVINRLAFSKTSLELQNKAETDLLTDLLNKMSTEKKIKEYISEEGKNKTCMMCVLDIDNFKKINDTMGHAFGDEVLSELGKQIRSEFRVSDIIGRTGGDEFIIFLKDLKDENVISREASRVETFFKNFTVGEYTKYSATASIGAAIYPRDASDFESLYKAADTALYKAKNRGKNQLAFYRDTVE